MAATQIQNCQRGVLFLSFLNVLIFFVFILIRLVKNNLLDKVEEDGDGDADKKNKYKEDEPRRFKAEDPNKPPS